MNCKHVCYVVLLLILPFCSLAQSDEVQLPTKFHFGPKIGMNFSQLDGDTWESGYRTNLLGGLYASLSGKRFGIVVEGLFSQSSYTTGKDFYSIYHSYYKSGVDSLKQGMFRVNYLNIPVLLQIQLMRNVAIQLGPQYSGVVNVKDREELFKDAKGLFKSGDISGVAGLQLNLPFHLVLGGRYVFGLSDLNATSVSDTWKNRSIQVHIGWNLL